MVRVFGFGAFSNDILSFIQVKVIWIDLSEQKK